MNFIWVALMAAAIAAAVWWVLKSFLPWFTKYRTLRDAVKDVGTVKPHWLLGHIGLTEPSQQGLRKRLEWAKNYPKCSPLWFGPIVFYFDCYHPDLLKTILSSEEPKDETVYKYLRPWIGDGLLTSHGKKWKRNRRLLTPAFHFDVLKEYLECINSAASEMLDKWSGSQGKPAKVELFRDVSLMALDNLLRCILSKKSNCQHGGNLEYLDAVKVVTEVALKRLFNPFYQFDFLFYLTPMGRRYKRALKIAHDYTENAIMERKAASMADGTKLDFLDILLKAKDNKGEGLTHQEICDEVDTFVFEGHDTVSSAISFAFYNLARHPELQEKCRDEVRHILAERKFVKWEDLPKMQYLTMYIKESMRLHPPVVGVARKLSQPYFFPRGFGSDQYNIDADAPLTSDAARTLPKGINIAANIFVAHHNPAVWSDPETFDPERFTPENISKRSPHAYVPFSSGPRNCIGQNFAMNELKVVLALALSRYRFSMDDAYPEPEIQPHLILRTTTGIHVVVERL